MAESIQFFSECPHCHHRRLQHGYEQVELIESLNTQRAIDGYCLPCDALWTISDQERSLVATLVNCRRS